MSPSTFEEAQKLVGEQKHLLNFWNKIEDGKIATDFKSQLERTNFADARSWFEESAHLQATSPENLKPVADDHYFRSFELSREELDEYRDAGLAAISRGEVAALVLAGGQASRLGSSQPKGTVPLGIATSSPDCLLGIQAAKISALQRLAAKKFPGTDPKIQWVIMTSQGTEKTTRDFVDTLIKNYNFDSNQVTMFNQDEIAAYDLEGNFLLAEFGKLVTAPNGNGGLYSALSPYLPELRKKGVKYFHVYCVDNILCKVADPHFLGMSIVKKADVATKTVPKTVGELVGSVCLDNGKPRVVEYSELGAELAELKSADGKFLFGAGSIANHFFTIDFLDRVCSPSMRLPYHRALKKISHLDKNGDLVKPDKPNAIKLEQFVFDVFEHSENFYIWEVNRAEEFSPLKNAESTGKDCLSTCLRDLAAVDKKWLEDVGVKTTSEKPLYLLADVSYDGEGLEELRDRQIRPEDVESDETLQKFFPKRPTA